MSDGLADFSALNFQDGALGARYAAFGGRGNDTQGAHFSGHQRHFDFGDLAAEQGVFEQRLAVLLLLGGNTLEVGQCCFGGTDTSQAGTFVSQQVLGTGPALVLFANQVLDRHFDVVKEDFVDFVVAVQGDDRANGDTRGRHVDQQEGDAALLLSFGVGTHQTEDPVGVLAQRGPGFLTVDDVVIAIAHGAGLQRGQVGTGARLGVTLTPPVGAVEDARQVGGFLFFGAELDDYRSNHVDAERHQTRCAGSGGLFVKDVLFDRAPGGATVLYRPARRVPAALGQDFLPALVVSLVQVFAQFDLLGDVGRQLLLQEFTHFITEGELFGRKMDFHCGSSL